MQASIQTADNAVVQFGVSLGERTGCFIHELTTSEEAGLRAAIEQPHSVVYLKDGVVTFAPPLPLPAPDPQIALDKTTVDLFMTNANGTATAAQRDEVIKSIIRYLWRRQ